MVNNISITNTVCYPELKDKLASKLVNKLKSSSNYNIIASSLNNKLLTQAKNSGNAYLIRLAKGQNIDYIVHGNIEGNNNYATLTIKLTDVKSGAIVCRRQHHQHQSSRSCWHPRTSCQCQRGLACSSHRKIKNFINLNDYEIYFMECKWTSRYCR